MGKWSEVKCNCSNRVPVKGTKPHEGQFECGHEDGTLFQTWPGNLFKVGYVLDHMVKVDGDFRQRNSFEVFIRIGDPGNYDDICQRLMLLEEDRDLWRLEIEELLNYLSGDFRFPYAALHIWEEYWAEFLSEEWFLKDPGSIESILAGGLKLCDASVVTENPVEFYW